MVSWNTSTNTKYINENINNIKFRIVGNEILINNFLLGGVVTWTSPGASSFITVVEGTTFITNLSASTSEDDGYVGFTVSDGDQDKFEIKDPPYGSDLHFKVAPTHSHMGGVNNQYSVTVHADDPTRTPAPTNRTFTNIYVIADTERPTMTITAAEGSTGFTAIDESINFTFTSSESTSNFTSADVIVEGGGTLSM